MLIGRYLLCVIAVTESRYPVTVAISEIHVCEGRSAIFPWNILPLNVDLGITVGYRYYDDVRNIIQKMPGTANVSYSNKRAEFINDTTLALHSTTPIDDGFYSLDTTVPGISYDDIKLVIHMAEDCPPYEAITEFRVVAIDWHTSDLVYYFTNNDELYESLTIDIPAHLVFIVRVPPAAPAVQCVIESSIGYQSFRGSITHAMVCSLDMDIKEVNAQGWDVSFELNYIAIETRRKYIKIITQEKGVTSSGRMNITYTAGVTTTYSAFDVTRPTARPTQASPAFPSGLAALVLVASIACSFGFGVLVAILYNSRHTRSDRVVLFGARKDKPMKRGLKEAAPLAP